MNNIRKKFLIGLSAWLMYMMPAIGVFGQIDTGSPYSIADHEKQVIGYVPNWDSWKGADFNIPKGALNHYNIDYSQYTILNFSFFGVAVDGSMHSGDLRNKQIYQDGQIQQPTDLLHPDKYSSHDQAMVLGIPQEFWGWDDVLSELGYEPNPGGGYLGWVKTATGETGNWPLTEYPTPGMVAIAHQYGIKVMASIGGWSMCKHFPEMAADPVKKARFIQDCVTLVEDYGFDGIDIDWEYPGPFAGMNFIGTEDDYHNYTLLMQDIREAIGPDRLITAAFSASPTKLENLEWSELNKVMDYYNMMTYDFHGGWSGIAGHNSPLYPYEGEEWGEFSWDQTFTYMRDQLGIDTEKINMGMAFYGRGVVVDGTPGVNAPTIKKDITFSVDGPVSSAADMNHWGATEGSPYYFQVKEAIANGGWTKHWDDQAKVPYLTKTESGVSYFTSYDDEESIKLKSEYITDNNIGGVIIWQMFTDWNVGPETSKIGTYPICPDTKPELVHVVNKVFAENAGPVNPAPVITITAETTIEQTELSAISFSFTASDDTGISTVEATANGEVVTLTSSEGIYMGSFVPTAFGEQMISVTAIDDQGKSATKTAKVVVVDPSVPNVAPTISITAPADASEVVQASLSAIEITTEAADEDGSIASVTISVDGQSFDTATASWTPSAFGEYTITAIVTDNEGETATATATVTITEETTTGGGCTAEEYAGYPSIYNSGDEVSFEGVLYEAQVNNLYNVTPGSAEHWWKTLGPCEVGPIAPQVSFVTPTAETIQTTSFPVSVSVVANATDEDGSVSTIEYAVNGTSITEGNYDITALGEYNFTVIATDNDGQTATDQVKVTVVAPQPVAPTVSFATLKDESVMVETLPYTLDLTSNSADEDGSIVSVEITVNGEAVSETTYDATTYGEYTIVATVTDNDGQTGTVQATVNITEPQPIAPIVSLTTPVAGSVEVETLPYYISLSSTSSDEDGDITSVVYTVNGVEVAEGDYSATTYGSYVVEVTATDNDGLTASAQATVVLTEPVDVVDCPHPTWNAADIYTGGNQVVHEGKIYRAKWWTQGNNPNGGDPWEDTGDVCGNGGLGDIVPAITFLHPSGDTYTALTTIDIEVEATDENGVVSNVTLEVDGVTVNGNSTSFTPVSFGTYVITASAIDDQNNTTIATKTVEFTSSAVTDVNADGTINITGPFAPAPTGAQRIIGYVPTWKGSPGDLDYSKVTHVNVSFLVYDTKVGGSYTDADFASGEYTAESLHVLDSLLPIIVTKAHSQGATVSIAVGGAEDYGFLKLMEVYQTNPASISAAADKLLAYVDQYNLDGIDLDMECWWADPAIPGTSEQGGRKRGTDKWNENVDQGAHPASYGLTLLAKKLRAKRPSLLLSSAVFATPWYGNNYDANMVDYLDWLGLMTYDFTGSWNDSPVGPHSSLYDVDQSKYTKASADNPIYSVETSLNYWSGDWATWQGSGHGVHESKLAIGVPFYGYDLSQTKAEAGQGANGFYFIGYDEILDQYPNAATSFDPNDANQLNGYIGEDGREIYYETPKGAGAKVAYARANGLQGTIIWELTFDVSDPANSLLQAMNNELSGNSRQMANKLDLEEELFDVVSYPNPFTQSTKIMLNVKEEGAMELQLFNLQGRLLQSMHQDVESGNTVLEIEGAQLSSGIYLVKVQVGEQQVVKRIIKK
ncbi:glycosyl hydrolase family 18 protein [Flammeovirga kamogawensis]|uniref:chitinase n=1 Tax=Flammeovirga kamogawensis TaxID=373891 RepID=A0ABX8GZE1_9BACT|nr:glycosyl hydrolase family 18 protein [Flammeovirga kamogawensis]MBB6463922.1 GH18 family chitinase/chitodextrinase [Flammeovirga kamogawensis]QWG08315.1 T9SS type A sorting domain-containing protein [Flammeovirga kamogawensis]TRX66611.1 T9SS type A sorting domain-containing protein [Flammeovirga kamogawensis]